MPIRQIPNTNQNYYLLIYDNNGRERPADDGRLLSQIVLQEISNRSVGDIFIMSHGWLGDIPSAISQYDQWMSNFLGCAADIESMKQKRPESTPLLIGMHWPSKPFGDENMGGSFNLDADATGADPIKTAVEQQLELLNAPAEIRPHLETIFAAYAELDSPEALPPEVESAYREIDRVLAVGDDERLAFDPEAIFQNALEAEQEEQSFGSFGKFGFGDLLAPLRALSFWQMKDRARSFGETGAHQLLRAMQQAAAGRDLRFHLMGHSFGCIVVSAMTAGAPGVNDLLSPVNSMMLVQGALSLWAYCPSLPSDRGKAGYFHSLIKNGRVKGPIVTTQSEHDSAVGLFYPLGAGIKRQVDFALRLPTFGAIGSYGIQGMDDRIEGVTMGGAGHQYNFQPGKIYNLESSDVIKHEVIGAGAHSDIVHPEIAHAWWQAALVL